LNESDEKIIIAAARAMAIADGKNPDDTVPNLFGQPVMHWRGYLREATLQLAAYRAFAKFNTSM
jgi:hypothetical protein